MTRVPESAGAELSMPGAFVVRPGDHLIVGIIGVLDEAEGARQRADLMAMLPDVEVTLLSGVSSMAVYRAREAG
jgi:hypothetical protein